MSSSNLIDNVFNAEKESLFLFISSVAGVKFEGTRDVVILPIDPLAAIIAVSPVDTYNAATF